MPEEYDSQGIYCVVCETCWRIGGREGEEGRGEEGEGKEEEENPQNDHFLLTK